MADGADGLCPEEELEVYRSLASEELQVEVLSAPGARKRPCEGGGEPAEKVPARGGAPSAEGEEEQQSEDEGGGVTFVLADPGPRGGLMGYYLGKRWEGRGAMQDADLAPELDGPTGTLASAGSPAVASSLVRVGSRADTVVVEEGTEAILSKIRFVMDTAEMADTPWRMPGANLADHFNFGLSEASLKEYVLKQIRMRLDARERQKIAIVEGGLDARGA
ncbi:unnamed protein product [Prorocentrum cordatum]|uniref:Pre-mRNA polyadenylation factor Fip1 domain-containing protein n=1 Tax=Prorocentrum cordatum TaxID=2364126 RepID=A0ABN9XX14_9DINO|nr:unnamed protein product [Polarella glacialis]